MLSLIIYQSALDPLFCKPIACLFAEVMSISPSFPLVVNDARVREELTTVRAAVGFDVPIPTAPAPLTIKCVPVDEPIANSGTPEPSAFGFTESNPHGVLVAIPNEPVFVKIIPKLSLTPNSIAPLSWFHKNALLEPAETPTSKPKPDIEFAKLAYTSSSVSTATLNLDLGVVVPIPTLPSSLIISLVLSSFPS